MMSQLHPVHISHQFAPRFFFLTYFLSSSFPIKILNAFLISTWFGITAAKTIFATAIVLIIFTIHSISPVFFSLLYPYLGCSIHVITLFPSSVALDRKKSIFRKRLLLLTMMIILIVITIVIIIIM